MTPILLGVDLGTTTITGLAFEPATRAVLSVETSVNDAEITSTADKKLGRSEWSPQQMVERACSCLCAVVSSLGARYKDVVGLGITGQQHGMVLVDPDRQPLTPLINWQDRRGDDPFPGTRRTYVEQAALLAGQDAPERTGCRLTTGFFGATMFWLQTNERLRTPGVACFIGDYLGSVLTGRAPVSDPTNAASSGLFDVRQRCWDDAILDALGLPVSAFPEIREANQHLGALSPSAATQLGLLGGIPVFVAMGDSQAAFLGSIDDCRRDVLINVGTGAQVAAAIDDFLFAPPLETRPLPLGGNLLVGVQPCGGRAYALLEGFFRCALKQLGGMDGDHRLYDTMNRLAESISPGADRLCCQPLFAGTRANPELRASWTGMSSENFTPAHLIRALLEGVAETLKADYHLIRQAANKSYHHIVGSGNGLRRNPVLRKIVAEKFAMPLDSPPHQEEAAVGAARMAAIGAGVLDAFPGQCRT